MILPIEILSLGLVMFVTNYLLKGYSSQVGVSTCMRYSELIFMITVMAVMLAGCSGAAGKTSAEEKPPTYTIQVTVSGLLGAGLVIKNNGGDDLPIDADGVYVFPTTLGSGSKYVVTIATQPLRPRQLCSLTGDSGEVAGANVTVTRVDCIDKFPPTVTNVVPESGLPVFDPDDALTIMFDDPVNSVTIGPESLAIYDQNNTVVPGSYSFPAYDQTRFTPQQPWHLASTYRLALTTTVKDTAGNPLSAPYEASFAIRDGAWRERFTIGSPGAVSNSNPVGQAVKNGDYNFLWSSTDTGVTSLNAQSYTRKTKTWSKPSTAPQPDRAAFMTTHSTANITVVGPLIGASDRGPLLALDLVNGLWSPTAIDISTTSSPLPGNNSKYALAVVSNSAGDTLVTWEQSGLGAFQTRANIYRQQAWNKEAFVVSKTRQDSSMQAAAIDAAGNAIAIWQDSDVSMRANHYSNKSGWGTSELIIGKAQPYNAPTKLITHDANGNAVAVWAYGKGTCCYEIVANDYRASGVASGWNTTIGTTIYTSNIAVSDITLNVSRAGDANVVWNEPAGMLPGYRKVSASWFTAAGRKWSTPASIAIYDGNYRNVVLGNGEVVIAFANSSSGSLGSAVFKEGNWSAVKPLWERKQEPHLIGPVALAQNTTQVLAVWSLSTDADHSLWSSRYADGVWSPDPVPVYKGGAENIVATSVNAVLDEFGNALVAWCVDRGDTTYDLYATRFTNGVWQPQRDKLNDTPATTALFTLELDKLGNTTIIWNEGGKFILRRFE